MQDKIRIILVDDQQLVRESWKGMLNDDPRFRVVAQCINSAEAIIEAGHLPADIILHNINRPAIEGFWETEDLLKTTLPYKVIAISENDAPRYVRQFMEAGVKGFMTKSSSFEELKNAIVQVYQGEQYICEEVRHNIDMAKR